MDWSYELLEPAEQHLFELVSVFADAEVSAVEAVADDVGAIDGVVVDVLDGLAGLVEKSLLRRVDVPGAEPRVAMLQTIRAFATDRLDQRPDVASRARRAHATHYAALAGRLRADLGGAGREVALDRLAADVANLRIAWAFWVDAGDFEQLDRLAKALLVLDDAHGWYLDTVGLASDMLAVLDAVPTSTERINQEIALRTTLARALMATKGFTPEVEAAFSSALERFERGVDVGLQFSVLRGLASLYLFRAQLDKSAEIGQQILALGEAEGDSTHADRRPSARGHDADELPRPQSRARALRHGHRPVPATAEGKPDGARRQRPARRVPDDLRLHPVDAGQGRSSRRARGCRVGARGGARPPVHHRLCALSRGPAAPVAARAGRGALPRDRASSTSPASTSSASGRAAGTVLRGAARVGLGRVDEGLADVRNGIGLYGELRSPPIFWPFLLFVQARACADAGRSAEGLSAVERCNRRPRGRLRCDPHARAMDREG